MPIASRSSRPDKQRQDILHPIATYYENFSLEHEFLLDLFGKSHEESFRDLQHKAAQIDWNHLFAIASPDLYGYLGYKLTEVALQNCCPALLLKEALDARRATAAQWLRLRLELRRLAAEFAHQQVDFLLLKGSVLAFQAYPDPSLRSVSDIDILVRSENLAKALECVYAAGFSCPERYAHPAGVLESALPGEEISLPLEKPGTRALIEVHTQLESAEPRFPVSIGHVWGTSEEADLGGLKVHIPDKHEFLFHLILHLARGHLFSLGLRPLLDIHLWVELQGKRLDWGGIAAECVRRRYGDWAHLTMRILCDTFRTPVPDYFFERVPPPPAFDRLQCLAYEQIWADRRVDSLVPQRVAITLSQRSVTEAITSLFKRVRQRPPETVATVPELGMSERTRFGAGFRRMLNDFKVKAPQYVRAWRKGSLRWSSLLKAARLARGCLEIKEILVDRSP